MPAEPFYTPAHAIRVGQQILQPDGNWHRVTEVVMDGPDNLLITLGFGVPHKIRVGVTAALMTLPRGGAHG